MHSFQRQAVFLTATLSTLLLNQGCVSKNGYTLNVMPPPAIVKEEIYDLVTIPEDPNNAPFKGVPYITDRTPIDFETKKSKIRFYGNERSPVLRVGFGEIEYSGKGTASEKSARNKKIPIKISSIEEMGFLKTSLPYGFLTDSTSLDTGKAVDSEFAELINQRLAASSQKDIFLYIHGFKTVFENPLLVTAEYWHFMGYKGVFAAYTWPATPKGFAYFKDTETAQLSGQNLRLAIEYLAQNTDAERIHIVGYSAGTRVVITAMHQLALINTGKTKEAIVEKYRIGQVALISSDYDANQFGVAIANGVSNVSESLTIYMSSHDNALGAAKLLFFGQKRLGQFVEDEEIPASIRTWILGTEDVNFIDVSAAKRSRIGKGHNYFRNSPWVSSDLLMSLNHGLTPSDRGLERKQDSVVWTFPKDYIERLKEAALTLE